MNLAEIVQLLGAEIICCEDCQDEIITYVSAGDLMSDILFSGQSHSLLLVTGLNNVQVIRTAEMLDITGIVFIRNKKPTEEMIELAKAVNIPLLVTPHTLYSTCGLLYKSGLQSAPGLTTDQL